MGGAHRCRCAPRRRPFFLLLLLALLDAAVAPGPGLPVSRPEDLASPVAPKSPSIGGPGRSAAPTKDHPPPPGTKESVVPTTLPSHWAGQVDQPTGGKAPAEQEPQMPPPAWVNAKTRQRGPPRARAGGPSRPTSPMTLLPTWTSLPTSALPEGHSGQVPGPTEGEGGGSASQEPPTLTLLPPGSRGAPAGQATWTGVETSSLDPKAGPEGGPTAEQWASPLVGTEGAERNAPEPFWTPRTIISSSSQVAGVPSGTTQGGTLPISAGQPLVNGTGHGPVGVPGLGPGKNAEWAQQLLPGGAQGTLLWEGGVPSEGPGRGTASEELAGDTSLPETRTVVSPGAHLAPHREIGRAGQRREEASLAEDHRLGSPGAPTLGKGSPPWPETEPPWEGSLPVGPPSSSPPPPQRSLVWPPPWVSSSPHPRGDGYPMGTPSSGPQCLTGGPQAPLWTPTGLPDAAYSLGGAPGKEGLQPPSLTPLPTQEAPNSTPDPRPIVESVWGGRMNRAHAGTTEDAHQQGLSRGMGPEAPRHGSPGMEGGQMSAPRVFPNSSRPPELHSKSQAFFGLTSKTTAGPTSEKGGAWGAPGQPAWTAHQWGVQSPTANQSKAIVQPGPEWVPTPDSLAGQLGNAGREGSPPAPTLLLAASTTAGPEEDAPRATGPPGPAVPKEGKPRAHPVVLIAENQPPLLKAAFLPVPCELVLDMAFSRSFRDPQSPEYQSLVHSLNETVSPLLASWPGFHRLEVRNIRPGSVVVEFEALFRPQTPGFWRALNRSALSERLPPGLRVGNASVLRSATRERPLDLCALLFSCQTGYECVMEDDARATCVSLCHRGGFCKNHGICTHLANHAPACQCPVGSDFWFLGARCDYRVTQQGVLGVACGLALSLVVLGVVVAGLVVRRVRMLLLEARADQTKSSYRRFCRLDDVSAHYWSEPWLASSPSLDNPAFSHSEELLNLQRMETPCHSGSGQGPQGGWRWTLGTPGGVCAAGRPSPPGHPWAESWSSLNDPMVDSGKASEVSVSSWPLEPPFRWSPFPVAQQKLPRDPASKTPRPNSCYEGMELVNLERSWTA